MSDYGSVDGVAAHSSLWTVDGEFLDPDTYQPGTNPPLETVESWLDIMSAFMNAALKDAYFTTPITEDFEVSFVVVNEQVNLLVADLVAARNQQGRFYIQTEAGVRNIINWAKVQEELQKAVKGNIETFLAEEVPQITTNPIRAGQSMVILTDDEL